MTLPMALDIAHANAGRQVPKKSAIQAQRGHLHLKML
jgi:hypothetical protein